MSFEEESKPIEEAESYEESGSESHSSRTSIIDVVGSLATSISTLVIALMVAFKAYMKLVGIATGNPSKGGKKIDRVTSDGMVVYLKPTLDVEYKRDENGKLVELRVLEGKEYKVIEAVRDTEGRLYRLRVLSQ